LGDALEGLQAGEAIAVDIAGNFYWRVRQGIAPASTRA